jgi:hypothetical protein
MLHILHTQYIMYITYITLYTVVPYGHNEVLEYRGPKICVHGVVKHGRERYIGQSCFTDGQPEGKILKQQTR